MTRKTDTSGVHVWLVLYKAARAVEACALAHVESLGFCLSDFAVLEALLHVGPLPVNALGAKVLLTSGSVTTAVDRLEARGLVERRSHAQDRRVRTVALTPSGRRLIAGAFAEHEEVLETATSALGRAERADLLALLRKLGHHAASVRDAVGGPHERKTS